MAAAADRESDVDLTPLLDLVLQLIMFFMACVNFVSDQINQNVLLPLTASNQEAQKKTEDDVIFINIELKRVERRDERGQVLLDETGRPLKELVSPRTTIIKMPGRDDLIQFYDAGEGIGLGKAQRTLNTLAEDIRIKLAARQRKKPNEITTLPVPVIIRADQDTRYGLVVNLIAQAKQSGYAKVELRAVMASEFLPRPGAKP